MSVSNLRSYLRGILSSRNTTPKPRISQLSSNLPVIETSENETNIRGWNFNSGNYLFTTDTK